MRVKSLIAGMLACLMFLVIGHGIIPHHHHFDNTGFTDHPLAHQVICQDNDLHSQSEHENCIGHSCGPETPPLHCHAFNGLDFLSQDFKSFSVIPYALASGLSIHCLQDNYDNPASVKIHPAPEKVRILHHITRASGLRAPPLSA